MPQLLNITNLFKIRIRQAIQQEEGCDFYAQEFRIRVIQEFLKVGVPRQKSCTNHGSFILVLHLCVYA
jgi:hypothetical protein